MDSLRIYWRGIQHLNHRGYIYIWANLLWIGLSIPIVTAPAAWAGLMILSHRAHTQIQVNLDDFWDGFKQHFRRALLNGVISFGIFYINIANLLSFTPVDWFGVMIIMFWISALCLWVGVQLYLWTILEEMKQPNLWGAYRNAGVMVLRNPFFTLSLLIGVLITLVLSLAVPPLLILLCGSVMAILGTGGALHCLRRAGYHNPEHHVPLEDRT